MIGVVESVWFVCVERKATKNGEHTPSAPCLFFHGMQRGKRIARSAAIGMEVSTARCKGVSQLVLRLMLESSWPASMRNSCLPD